MPPLPPNSTTRFFFDYVTGDSSTSTEHTVIIRVNSAINDVDTPQQALLQFLQALGPANFRINWRVIRVRVQAAGSDFSLPVTLASNLASFVGTSSLPYSARLEALESTFQGRSTTSGRRVDLSLYRAHADASGNFRVQAGGSGLPAAVAGAVNVLRTQGANGIFLAIDGSAPQWYNYMNENYNSYWERRLRLS